MAKQNRTGDKETDEILAEMEEEGFEIPESVGMQISDADEGGESSEKKDDTATSTETSTEEEEDEESDDAESSDEDEEEEDGDEESDEEDSDDDETEGEDSEDEKKKEGKLGLVQKYRKNKKLLKDALATIDALKASKSNETFDEELKKFSEESGIPLEAAKKFVELVGARNGLSKEMVDEITASRKERRETEYWSAQHKGFEKDFRSNVMPVLETLGLSEEQISKVKTTLDTDTKSPFWAWDKKNEKSSLVKLALGMAREMGKGKNRQSSEGSSRRGSSFSETQKEPSEMSGEDINSMSDEEFDKFADGLGKKSRSVVHRA